MPFEFSTTLKLASVIFDNVIFKSSNGSRVSILIKSPVFTSSKSLIQIFPFWTLTTFPIGYPKLLGLEMLVISALLSPFIKPFVYVLLKTFEKSLSSAGFLSFERKHSNLI